MCGFAGVIAWDERYRCSRQTLAKMSAAVAHRGPDGEGFHVNHDEQITSDHPQVSLAFRRLAILDPDPRSMQPFTDGRHWLVFNGEIYNFRELKKELSVLRPDYAWRTTGDTEVLLLAYAVWGEKCVEHLNGMFAFAVWDEVEKALFLARDRMGQKPLYWSALTTAGAHWFGSKEAEVPIDPPMAAIAFASEITGLIHLPWVTKATDYDGVNGYLRWGYIPAPRTVFTGIRNFLPALCGTLRNSAVKSRSYFRGFGSVEFPPDEVTSLLLQAIGKEESPAASTRRLVQQAVERQLVSDVPLGCLLSGGIDSSVIAACMKSVSRTTDRVHTFSIGFDDPLYDESEYAAAVAEHLGTTHHRFSVKPSAADDLQTLAKAFGEPFGDSSALPTHYLCREVRGVVKVALGGDGADELFGGYDRYRAMHIASGLDRTPDLVRRAAAAEIWQKLPGTHPKSLMSKIKRFLRTADSTPVHRYMKIMSIFSSKQISGLFSDNSDRRTSSDWQFAVSVVSQMAEARGAAPLALAVDRVTYLPGDLLTKVDRCSMLHGLEVRSPFMDHELVQFAAGLTTDQLLKGGPKRMLREAFKDDLPAWVFKRKKMGFAVPIGDWFRGPLRGMLRDTLFSSHAFGRSHFDMKVVERLVEEHESKRVDHSQRLYALLMLELWWNTARAVVSA
jgi:asparagine synthase (glutamine-hydrolysing)